MVFARIAQALHVTRRYVGEEPFSQVTGIYNQIMASRLPLAGIECIVVPRKQAGGRPISASAVRQLLQKRDFEALKELVPPSTLEYFQSDEAAEVMERICGAGDVAHY